MNAVIYCRVSSRDQVEGTSLDSQETACRDYAHRHGLQITRVFIEEGESAKFADRTQLLELLEYCRQSRHVVRVLLVWKLDRFARNVEDHFAIKAILRKMSVRVVSVTEPIDSDPNGKLMETILAGFAQFDNDLRALRAVQGMQQRLKEGILPWKPPLGYLPPKIGKKTQPDGPDPQSFGPLQKAWQLMAGGAFTQSQIAAMLDRWGVRAYRGGRVSAQTLGAILRNPFYAGILRDPWTAEEHTGRHVPMVTQDEFANVQRLLAGSPRAIPHVRLSDSFPLRGIVRCPTCGSRLTACYSRGSSKVHPYYLCRQKRCDRQGKSYRRDDVHNEFREFLGRVCFRPGLKAQLVRCLIELADHEADSAKQGRRRKVERRKSLEGQLRELIAMRAAHLVSDVEFVAQRDDMRRRIDELGAEVNGGPFKPLSETEAATLADEAAVLATLWAQAPLTAKVEFEQLALPAGYVVSGIRTAEKGPLFRVIEAFSTSESNVVHLESVDSNALIADIRRFLALVESINQPAASSI